MIVDAQVHLWAAETAERPWIPGGSTYAHLPTPIDADTLIAEMDRVGVDRALVVSPTWEGDRNDVVLAAAGDHPDRIGAIVRFDLSDSPSSSHFEAWSADPRVFGARAVYLREAAGWLKDGTSDWLWPLAERLKMPVMVFAPGQYEDVARVARRHPDLKLAVCHLGLDVSLRDEEIVPEIDRLLPLADLPNVAVKATSLPSYVTEPFPFRFLGRQVERVVAAFGPERVFWGSDLSRLSCDYEELVSFFTDELDLDDGALRLIMGDAACEWFGWPAPATRSE